MKNTYNKIFLKYFHNRKQSGLMNSPSLQARVSNPICGDNLNLFIKIDTNAIIIDAKFLTNGCAATIAIASFGTEDIIGKSLLDIKKISSEELKEGVGGLPSNKGHAAALFIQAIKKSLKKLIGSQKSILIKE